MPKIKVLLTGANGFIGKNLVKSFSEKYELFAPNKNEVNFLDKSAVKKYITEIKPSIVVHAANVGGNRRLVDIPNVAIDNLRMFFNLIDSKDFFDRLIILGSGAEYDKRRSIIKIKEEEYGTEVPVDEYGFAKYTMSQFAKKVNYITHLRLFGVYGSFEDSSTRFISNVICKALLDLPITIKQNVLFDYLYIKDLVQILDYFIINKPKQTFYNIGKGESLDLVSIAENIIKIMDKKLPIVVENFGLNKEYTCNVDRLKSEISNLKYIDFEESLNEMIAFYQSELPQINKTLFSTNI